jgi:hypothetical protein
VVRKQLTKVGNFRVLHNNKLLIYTAVLVVARVTEASMRKLLWGRGGAVAWIKGTRNASEL